MTTSLSSYDFTVSVCMRAFAFANKITVTKNLKIHCINKLPHPYEEEWSDI